MTEHVGSASPGAAAGSGSTAWSGRACWVVPRARATAPGHRGGTAEPAPSSQTGSPRSVPSICPRAPALVGHLPERDATVVAKLRSLGAVIVGKTATHQLAYGPTDDRTGGAPQTPVAPCAYRPHSVESSGTSRAWAHCQRMASSHWPRVWTTWGCSSTLCHGALPQPRHSLRARASWAHELHITFRAVQDREAYSGHAERVRQAATLFDPEVLQRLLRAGRTTAAAHARARTERAATLARLDEIFAGIAPATGANTRARHGGRRRARVSAYRHGGLTSAKETWDGSGSD